jgi:Domain of unknown function (DUF4403)
MSSRSPQILRDQQAKCREGNRLVSPRNNHAARAAVFAKGSHTIVDLKPFANDAKAKIAVALKDFQQSGDDVRVDTAVNGLRLTGIEYDARTLRVVAEPNGAVKVAVTQLPR